MLLLPLTGLQGCDRIYVLAEGRVVEQGRHEELLAARGVYFDMWRAQARGLGSFLTEFHLLLGKGMLLLTHWRSCRLSCRAAGSACVSACLPVLQKHVRSSLQPAARVLTANAATALAPLQEAEEALEAHLLDHHAGSDSDAISAAVAEGRCN